MKNAFSLLFLCFVFGCTAGKKQPIEVGSKRFHKLSDSAKDSVLVAQGILPTLEDSAAYAIGIDYANSLQKIGITELNFKAFTQAMSDFFVGRDLKMSKGEAGETIRNFAKKRLNTHTKSNQDKGATNEKIAYALGMDHARKLKTSGVVQLNSHAFTNAAKKVLANDTKNLLIPPQLSTQITQEYLANLQYKIEKENREKGEAFLAKNRERKEVTVIESGLQYEILRQGTGKKPSIEDIVKVHYHGTLVDGSVFDSSVERGETATFPVKRVIKGWVEVLQLMPVGSKWKVYIPSELAYGTRGTSANIGPNEALIFEIELLGIEGEK